MSCDNSNIRQNYIVVGGGDSDIISACTAFYVTNIEACDPISGITINSNIFIDGETTINDNLILNSVSSGNSQNVLVIDNNGVVMYTNNITGGGTSGTSGINGTSGTSGMELVRNISGMELVEHRWN
jgi:hypothetical protein